MAGMSSNEVYEAVTAEVVAALEAGTVPWAKPWRVHENPVSGTKYRGINPLLLDMTAERRGYQDHRWVTFRQSQALKGKVRKGERSTIVIFWKMLKFDAEGKQNGEISSRDKVIPMLRYYRVFNVEQCDGLTLPEVEFSPVDVDEECEQIVDGMPNAPSIGHGGTTASYSPMFDRVQMPGRHVFDSTSGYYGTLFHELTHATGHGSRLDRDTVTESDGFGGQAYAREELVAELGAAMLLGVAGASSNDSVERSAAYIESWLKALADDPKLLVWAGGRAQRAADYIRGEGVENVEREREAVAA